MATNDFLTFAASASANVYTNAEYVADGDQLNGNQPGIAKSKLVNKAVRQGSIMSAVLAQFIVDRTGLNAVDDGTTETLLTNLKTATNDVARATIDTIADLRLTPFSDFDVVSVIGYYTASDNIGVREYYWDAVSTETDNGGTIIAVTGVVTGRWRMKFDGLINDEWFGGVYIPQSGITTTQRIKHDIFDEIVNDTSPLNYSSTTALKVVQHRLTSNGTANQLIPSEVHQYRSTGDGIVNAGIELSETIWQGQFNFMEKTGDGSAHTYTSIGELGIVGTGGYNELGLFQGEGTNKGSVLGTISGAEMLLKDSPDGGVTSYSTKMQAVVGRVAKYNPTDRKSYNFYASSEGTLPISAIIGLNPNGNDFQRGFDFADGNFTTGEFGVVPNNTALAWLNSTGSAIKIMGVSNTNMTYIRAASLTSSIALQDFGGTTRFEIEGDGEVSFLNQTVSASATAGTNGALPLQVSGYLITKINGGQVKLPYYNV
jgi:hypothetical protein